MKVHIDETGLEFLGCRRQSHHRSERWASHVNELAWKTLLGLPEGGLSHSGQFRCLPLRHPLSGCGRSDSKGSDAFPLRAIYFHVALSSDPTLVWAIYIGFRQEPSDRAVTLHAALRRCKFAALSGAMGGSRIAFGATSQVKEDAKC